MVAVYFKSGMSARYTHMEASAVAGIIGGVLAVVGFIWVGWIQRNNDPKRPSPAYEKV